MCRCIDSRAICVMGSFVALIGGVCLAALTAMTTKPYHYAKDFNEVTCTSEGYTSFDVCCAFTSRATCDKYPCVQALVTYETLEGSTISNMVLYYDFQSAEFQGDNASCSFYDCPSEYKAAEDELDSFIEDYATSGRTFTCYHDDDHETVIIKTVSLMAVIHSWVWPSIAFIVGLVIALLAYREKIGIPPPHDEDDLDDEMFDRQTVVQDYIEEEVDSKGEGGESESSKKGGITNKVGVMEELDVLPGNEGDVSSRTKSTTADDKVLLATAENEVDEI